MYEKLWNELIAVIREDNNWGSVKFTRKNIDRIMTNMELEALRKEKVSK